MKNKYNINPSDYLELAKIISHIRISINQQSHVFDQLAALFRSLLSASCGLTEYHLQFDCKKLENQLRTALDLAQKCNKSICQMDSIVTITKLLKFCGDLEKLSLKIPVCLKCEEQVSGQADDDCDAIDFYYDYMIAEINLIPEFLSKMESYRAEFEDTGIRLQNDSYCPQVHTDDKSELVKSPPLNNASSPSGKHKRGEIARGLSEYLLAQPHITAPELAKLLMTSEDTIYHHPLWEEHRKSLMLKNK